MSAQRTLDRPIIIMGAPRSGTTFLAQILQRHPDVGYLVEPRITWRYGNDHKSDVLTAADARPEVVAHIRSRFVEFLGESDKPRLLEKTPSNSLRPEVVDAVLPDARFIHVIRHGAKAVVSAMREWETNTTGLNPKSPHDAKGSALTSLEERPHRALDRWKEMGWRQRPFYVGEALQRLAPDGAQKVLGTPLWGPRLPGMRQMLRDLTTLEVSALQWRMCVEISRHFGAGIGSDRYMEVRFEDLDEATVGAMLAFAGLEPSEAVSGFFRDTHRPDIAAADTSRIDPDVLSAIERWIAPTQAWLGY